MVVQSIPLVSDLQNQRRNIGVIFLATGLTTEGDAGGGIYFWEPTNTTAPDGFFVIQVTGVTVGRWVRIYAGSNIYNTDGSLTSNRTVTLNGHSITFAGSSYNTTISSIGNITAGSLSGSGTRMVVAGPTGALATQDILVGPSARFTEQFVATAGQTTFNTINTLTASFFDIFVNGVRLDDLSYTFTANQFVLNDACVADDIVDITGLSSLNVAAPLPSQTGHAGEFLQTNGTNILWASAQLPITLTTTGSSGAATFVSNTLNIPTYTLSGLGGVPTTRTLRINGNTYDLSANRIWNVGTVTSVDMSVPAGFAISGNPVVGFGTLAITYAAGYSLPTTAKQSNWDDAYTWVTQFPTQTGNGGKYLTTNGSALSWSAVDALPSQTGNAGKYLTTDGSIASWATISLSGYVPTSRTLTINGTVYDLTANRTWSVGTVTSVAALTIGTTGTDITSAVATGTTTPVITLNIPTASAANRGALSSADWTTFNNKQNALTFGNLTESTSSVLTITGGSNAVIGSGTSIQVKQSSSSQGGFLSSTDWTTFNNKQSAITLTTTGSSGASTFVSNTLNIPNYTLAGLGGVPTTRTLTINGTGYDLSVDRSWSVGTVTSVALVMPAAFSVSGSPVTNSGTLTVTGAGTSNQYIRGDGSLADFPTNGGGGGASVSYYMNGGTSQGTFGGNTYYQMSKTAVFGSAANFTINANGYIAEFLTNAGDPGLLNIPAGNWSIQAYFSASSPGGAPSFYVELYKYNGTTFTLIATGSGSPEVITGGTSADLYYTTIAVPATTLTVTDRLAIRFYVTHDSRTITMYTQDAKLAQVTTTFTSGVTALNGLTTQVQYLATGTSGTDFNISSLTDTHTFNIPVASATNTGKLSNTDWSTFNNKQNALTFGNLTETTSSVLTITGGTNAVIGSGTSIQVKQSSGSQSGFLSSTDWTTFNNKLTSPMTTLGDIIYGGTSGTATRLAGNTTTTKQFLIQTGTGSVSAAPSWGTISSSDLPALPNAITFNNGGSGAASGTTFDGSAARTISYNTIGAQPLATNLTSLAALSYSSLSFVKMSAAGTFSLDTNTYLTANQSITLSGDVSGTGTTAITTTIGANKVTNSMLAQVATSTFKGRTTAGTGNVEDLTSTQATALLNTFTSTLKGLAPASGGGTTNYLRADGTWAATGTVTSVSVVSANGFAGTVATASSTPAITLTTTVTGLLKGNGTAISAAVANTDYLPVASPAYTGVLSTGTLTFTPANHFAALATASTTYNQLITQNSGSNPNSSNDIVVNNNLSTDSTYFGDFGINSSTFTGVGSFNLPNAVYLASQDGDLVLGTFSSNVIRFVVNNNSSDAAIIKTTGQLQLLNYTSTSSFSGTAAGYLAFDSSGNIITASSGSGTVTSVSVVSANGFAGTVATASSTPAITLTTTITGVLKGDGTSISAAVAGTDYVIPSALSSYVPTSRTLNTLALSSNQTFATGTTGTDFNISSSGTTHTFNIPDAGQSARGLVTTTSQNFSGTKTFFNGIAQNNLAYNLVLGSQDISNTGNSPYLFGGSTTTNYRVALSAGTLSANALIANAVYAGTIITSNSFTTSSTAGVHPIVANLVIRPVSGTIGTGTITNSATVYIQSASSVTATNIYSLWVDDGTVRLDGAFELQGIANTSTSNVLYYDTTTKRVTYAVATSLTDGDKGDITVSSSGSVWTIDNSVVTVAKISATGTPSSSTYLRGDGTWSSVTATAGYTISTKTTTYTETATSGDIVILCDTSSAGFTVTLPTAVSNNAKITVKKISASNILTIDGNGSETIDGGLTADLKVNYASVTLVSNGTNWYIV